MVAVRRADRPWWEGGAAKLSTWWTLGMVACYHPIPDREDMGYGIERCGWCRELRNAGGYWPPTSAPRVSKRSG